MSPFGKSIGPIRLRADGRETHPRTGTRFIATVGERPRLSWTVPASWQGRRQCGFELRIAVDSVDPRGTDADLLADIREDSSDNALVLPFDLEPFGAWHWTVRVLDEHGEWSDWAEPASLTTGPLAPEDWHGEWVSHPAKAVLRVPFALDTPPVRASLHITAQGLVRAAVNNLPINAEATDATRTDYVRSLYRSYEITDACRAGDNNLDLTLARGEWERTGLHPRVLAEVVIEQADGTRLHVGTGGGMRVAPSEVTVEEPFYLERHEPTLAPERFSPSPELRVITPVDHRDSPDEAPRDVQPDPTPALHDVFEIHPVEVGRVGDARIFDVGVNIAGRSDLELSSAVTPGLTIRVVHGEHLDATGRLDTTNLTMPFDHGRVRQAVEYLTTGLPGQRCTPWFAYHGFRYVEVQGLPDDASIRMRVRTHHTDLSLISRFETDDDQVNRLIQRAPRTVLNNVHGIPEDCPTREQSGWTGDTAAATEFEFAAFDTEAFFRKWLADMRTSQQADGSIPAITPDLRSERIPADPVWGAALQRVLMNHWNHYGDRRVVDENLPTLRRWADFQLAARDVAGVVSRAPISYGSDWLALEQTPPPIHHTAAAIDCLLVLADLEDAVGDPTAASVRRLQVDELQAAARHAFFDEARGTFGNGSQGSYGCAIEAGILTGDEVESAAARIEADIRARGNRVSSGFATTRSVVLSLARTGRSGVLFDILQQRAEPGIGAMVDHGPGTLWECWWIDPNNTGTGSLDHVGLGGAFATWAWQHLAGVRPIAPGYTRFEVAPQFVAGIDSLTLDTETIRGTVHVEYRRKADRAAVTVAVPVGSEAIVVLPGSGPRPAGPGRHEYDIAWPTTIPSRPAERAAPWHPPSSAQVSTDVDGGIDLLAVAVAAGRCSAGGAYVDVLADGIHCMPVPHAQLPGPVLHVTAAAPRAALVPLARIEFDAPLDLTRARFAYAMVDLCADPTGGPVDTVIVLHAVDGSSVEATGRFWPAGWNRVSIDIADWAPRSAVVAIEAGIRYSGDDEPTRAADSTAAPSFHLGEVGYSTLERTW